jgi:flavine halogenase
MHEKTSAAKRRVLSEFNSVEYYREQLKLTPNIMELISDATLVDNRVRNAGDTSYHATAYSGDHFRVVGDAAGKPMCFAAKVMLTFILA